MNSELDFFDVPDLAKSGSGIRSALVAHCKAAAAEHSEMADFHKRIHDSLDDSAEHKHMHKRLSEHHATNAASYAALHKALSGEDADVPLGDAGPTPHGPKAIRPDHVRIAGTIPQHVKLVLRAGSNPGGDVVVSPENEELFSGV